MGAVADRQRHALRRRRDAGRGAARRGRLADGVTEGGDFHAGDGLFCASGVSLRRVHSHFSPVVFLGAADKTTAADTDQTMSVSAGVSDAFAEFVRSDLTYEVAAADDAGVVKWKWRKWAKGMFPGGTFSELNVFSTAEVELEYGVRVSFASATGKTATDVWRFDAVTANPYVARGEFLAPQRVLCPLPPPTRARPTWTQPPRARSRSSRCRTAASPRSRR